MRVSRPLLPSERHLHSASGWEPHVHKESAHNAIYFTKEQFNAGLRFPLPSIFKEFFHYTQIPLAYIHPNTLQVLMGYNILNMLFNLNLSLLEVLFVYTIKKGKKGHLQHVCPYSVLSTDDQPS